LNRTWFGFINGSGDFGKVRLDHRPIDCREDQHRKMTALKPLRALRVLVAGYKDLKAFAFDQGEQDAILMPPDCMDTTVWTSCGGRARISF